MEFDSVLGILGKTTGKTEGELCSDQKELIARREKARENKDWKTADAIRHQLKEKGVILIDTPDGVKWKRTQSKRSND